MCMITAEDYKTTKNKMPTTTAVFNVLRVTLRERNTSMPSLTTSTQHLLGVLAIAVTIKHAEWTTATQVPDKRKLPICRKYPLYRKSKEICSKN